jgi:hypothetical protein
MGNIPTKVWEQMVMDPVEREARMLARAKDGKEDGWQSHAWEAYQRLLRNQSLK